MKKILLVIIGFLLFACSDKKSGELLEIPVDTWPETAFPLSEITEEITAIELEVTDQSLMTSRHMIRILLCGDNVIVAESGQILVFDRDGKFIRTIGSKGQGPGEFSFIKNVALDEKNRRIFANASPRVICYDLNGELLKESSSYIRKDMSIIDMNYINGELLVLGEHIGLREDKGRCNLSSLYRLNDELQIIDSCIFRNVCFEKGGFFGHRNEDFILHENRTISFYYSDFYMNTQNPAEVVQRDTLYSFEKNRFIPELKLKFKNDGILNGEKYIQIYNIYRSSRYVFTSYIDGLAGGIYYFCYDTKTGKGYKMKDGFTDDIHQIEDKVKIHPLALDTEYFYYWHTHINDDDIEEPNPTLYIAKLKK